VVASGTVTSTRGRYRSFPVESDDHFYQVVRYIERNALRADVVAKAEETNLERSPSCRRPVAAFSGANRTAVSHG